MKEGMKEGDPDDHPRLTNTIGKKHRQEYSEVYREAGAAAIAVNVDPLTGGCAHRDIQEMAREQQNAINNDVAGMYVLWVVVVRRCWTQGMGHGLILIGSSTTTH